MQPQNKVMYEIGFHQAQRQRHRVTSNKSTHTKSEKKVIENIKKLIKLLVINRVIKKRN